MKKTFLLKATACALCGLTLLGATALVITVLALCGVPVNWWIGALCVIPALLILVGLAEVAYREKRKMGKAFVDSIFDKMKDVEEEEREAPKDQTEGCRFREGEKCTFGDGLPKCAKEQTGEKKLAGGQRKYFDPPSMQISLRISCEDPLVHYMEYPDGLRLIFHAGKYVGWYVCDGHEAPKGISDLETERNGGIRYGK